MQKVFPSRATGQGLLFFCLQRTYTKEKTRAYAHLCVCVYMFMYLDLGQDEGHKGQCHQQEPIFV